MNKRRAEHALARLAFGDELHTLEAVEISILRPEGCVVRSGRRQDDAVGQRQFAFVADLSGAQCQSEIQFDDQPEESTRIIRGHVRVVRPYRFL